ncbi:unnamed protein product [Ixodes persulcatus]
MLGKWDMHCQVHSTNGGRNGKLRRHLAVASFPKLPLVSGKPVQESPCCLWIGHRNVVSTWLRPMPGLAREGLPSEAATCISALSHFTRGTLRSICKRRLVRTLWSSHAVLSGTL